MNWNRYLEIKQDHFREKRYFVPENQKEAKQALALGVIDIGQYAEFSLTTEPLLDSIHDPDPNTRKGAIRKIAGKKSPFSARMLHSMLSDGDEEVRLYAASEIDRLEAEQQKQIHKLRKKLKTDPDNPDYRFELAKQYIEYARILLISPNLRSFFLNHAIDILSANLRYRKNDPAYLFYRGLAYKISGDKQNALKDLKKAVRTGKNYLPAFIELADVYISVERFDYVKMIMSTISIKKQNIEEFHAQLFWQN